MRLLHKMVCALTVALAVPVAAAGLVAASALEAVEVHATREATRSLVEAEVQELERLAGERAQSIEAILAPLAEDVRVLKAAFESTTRPGMRVPGAEVYPPSLFPGYGRVDARLDVYADFEQRGPGSPWVPRYAVKAARSDPATRRRLAGDLDRLMQVGPLLRDVTTRRQGTLDLAWVVLTGGAVNTWPPYDYPTLLRDDPALADLVEADEDYVRLVSPAENPRREVRWIEPYFDPFKGLWMTSCAAPLYQGEVFEGAVGLDLLLPTVAREVLQAGKDGNPGLFLLTGSGRLVAAGPMAVERLGRDEQHRAALRHRHLDHDGAWTPEEIEALKTPLVDHPDPEVRALVRDVAAGGRLSRKATLGGVDVFVASAPVPSVGWTLVVLEPEADVLAGVDAVREVIQGRAAEAGRQFRGSMVLVVLLGTGVGALLYGMAVRPIVAFTRRVERLSPDALDFAPDELGADEFGQLQRKFAELLAMLRKTRDELLASRDDKERQVEERTAELRDREAALRQLEEARRALVEADRHKDQFLAMLGHELRNPLFAIRNAVWLLGRPGLSPEERCTLQGVLDRQSSHMGALVEGLLDVSRIARGKLALHKHPVDVAELVRRVVHDRAPSIEARGLALGVETAESLWVEGDEVRLTQVFTNLLGNAIKFTPPGGKLTVRARREGEEVVVRVRDTGVGIDPALQPYLFEAFRQGPQDLDRSEGGLGLGLALSKGLVGLHGGALEAHSEGRGKGSEFVVRLPPGHAPAPAREAPAVAGPTPCRVLVVEDNEDTARLLAQVLEQAGHVVTVARSGREAIERVRADRPEVVLCDLGLPEVSGYDVAREVRADPALRGVRLVALTGYGQAEDVRRTHEAGFDLHLTKPVDPDAIEAALARWAA